MSSNASKNNSWSWKMSNGYGVFRVLIMRLNIANIRLEINIQKKSPCFVLSCTSTWNITDKKKLQIYSSKKNCENFFRIEVKFKMARQHFNFCRNRTERSRDVRIIMPKILKKLKKEVLLIFKVDSEISFCTLFFTSSNRIVYIPSVFCCSPENNMWN